MDRPPLVLLFALLPALALCADPPSPQRIVVSPNGRFLQLSDGKPFFWLADTAWLLFERLGRADTEKYLANRQNKAFTVVQTVLLHGAGEKDSAGHTALIDDDPARPNLQDGYWQHVDWVVEQAAAKGIYVALLPVWGSVVKSGQVNANNVVAYSTFLAGRFKRQPNVVWVLGGDVRGDQNGDVWQLMGRTLKSLDPNHLVTFHPFGRTQSSTWVHDAPWLDFNMFQSGHQRYDQDTTPNHFGEDNWRYVDIDYAKRPAKPVIDGEPSYEGIPQGLHDTTQPDWTDADARRYAYWSVFAGAAGHTYGDNAVMQFYRLGKDQGAYGPKKSWSEALDDPGAGQMRYLKLLMLSRPFFDRVPDQSLIAAANGEKHDRVMATRGKDHLFAYTYTGKPFQIRMGAISGREVVARWYNPRDGSLRQIGSFPNRGVRTFTPPGDPGEGNDWVLILDDPSKHLQVR